MAMILKYFAYIKCLNNPVVKFYSVTLIMGCIFISASTSYGFASGQSRRGHGRSKGLPQNSGKLL